MATTSITTWGTWCCCTLIAIGRTIMHQSKHLHRRVPHGALVRLERSAVKVARCVLRGERSREAPDLPGARCAKLGQVPNQGRARIQKWMAAFSVTSCQASCQPALSIKTMPALL